MLAGATPSQSCNVFDFFVILIIFFFDFLFLVNHTQGGLKEIFFSISVFSP